MISACVFYILLHVEEYNRVVEILYSKEKIIVEVLQVFFPYEPEYDSKRINMDKNRDGNISNDEIEDFAQREGIANALTIILKVGERRIPLKMVKSKLEEYPHRTFESRPIAVWHRFEAENGKVECGNFVYRDLYPFRKAVVKMKLKGVCGVKEKELVRELTPSIREVKFDIKEFKQIN